MYAIWDMLSCQFLTVHQLQDLQSRHVNLIRYFDTPHDIYGSGVGKHFIAWQVVNMVTNITSTEKEPEKVTVHRCVLSFPLPGLLFFQQHTFPYPMHYELWHHFSPHSFPPKHISPNHRQRTSGTNRQQSRHRQS